MFYIDFYIGFDVGVHVDFDVDCGVGLRFVFIFWFCFLMCFWIQCWNCACFVFCCARVVTWDCGSDVGVVCACAYMRACVRACGSAGVRVFLRVRV